MALRWHIDACNRYEIGGWADNDGPLASIEIAINGRRIAQLSPTNYREDLEAAGFGDGRRGFGFVVAGHLHEPVNVVTISSGDEVLHRAVVSTPHAGNAIAFLQTADPERYRPLLEITSRTVIEYCRRNNFAYKSFIGICRGNRPWHATFNRILLLRHLLDDGFRGWVCYVDADAFVADLGFDLATYLADKGNLALIAATDRPGEPNRPYWLINVGVFLINLGHPVGRQIVTEWAERFLAVPDHDLLGASEWAFHDQSILQELLHDLVDGQKYVLSLRGSPNLINYYSGAFIKQVLREHGNLQQRFETIRAHVDEIMHHPEAFDDFKITNEEALENEADDREPAAGRPPLTGEPVIVRTERLSLLSAGSNELLYAQEMTWPRRPPLLAYEGQGAAWTTTYSTPNAVQLITLNDVFFVIGPGYDGLVITKDRHLIEQTTFFSDIESIYNAHEQEEAMSLPISDRVATNLQDVFLGFDCGWMNYFHWICYAVAKSYIADRLLPSTSEIILPDYVSRSHDGEAELWFSERVWRESLGAAGLAQRATFLPVGLYHAERLRLIWPRDAAPTDILRSGLFSKVFQEIGLQFSGWERANSLLLISRENARDPRLDPAEFSALRDSLTKRGFQVVALEALSFLEQVQLFHGARLVVGAHGAGLANILFGSSDLRVLELNREIGGEGYLRPWFYELASSRGLAYSVLNGDQDGFSVERVNSAIDRLLQI